MLSKKSAVLFALVLLPIESPAFVYVGNPILGFRIDRPQGDHIDGSVTLTSVRVIDCAGGHTDYEVNKTIDPVAGYEVQITGGDLCGVTYNWGSSIDINGTGSLDDYTVQSTASSTTVALGHLIMPAHLTQWSVTVGSMSGGGPQVFTYIEDGDN